MFLINDGVRNFLHSHRHCVNARDGDDVHGDHDRDGGDAKQVQKPLKFR